jgi:hypothetical protein
LRGRGCVHAPRPTTSLLGTRRSLRDSLRKITSQNVCESARCPQERGERGETYGCVIHCHYWWFPAAVPSTTAATPEFNTTFYVSESLKSRSASGAADDPSAEPWCGGRSPEWSKCDGDDAVAPDACVVMPFAAAEDD